MENEETTSTSIDDAFVAGQAASERSEMRERFAHDLQALATHAQELLEATTSVSGEGIAAAREQLRESLAVAGEALRQMQGEALDQGRRMARRTDSYVHDNPWQAIAIGMIAGLALGVAGASMSARRGAQA